MLTEICAEVKNYFSNDGDKVLGTFAVVDGAITPSVGIADDQYYRIVGSVYNDGVHRQGDVLVNEDKFSGAVWRMRVPQDFIDLAEEISKWQDKNGSADSVAMSPFTSESFGGYSYSKAKSNGDEGSGVTWQSAFANRLDRYRKIRSV